MPSAIIHLMIADILREKLSLNNVQQYYLGSIAPDAVNLDGFAPQNERYVAHLRSTDYEKWKQSAIELYNQSFNNENQSDFLKGYAVHLLSDILWDETVQPHIFAVLKQHGFQSTDLKEQKWIEIYRYNSTQRNAEWWVHRVKGELINADATKQNCVDSELLTEFRDYVTNNYQDKYIDEVPWFITDDIVAKTADNVAEYLKNNSHII